ncbi:hypothetical protein SAMN05444354_12438 [Stigmatella aurantiaca]|uniref:site-specific DNA-methyltransferase (adenine-specific) n=1 Tax=Stigmatella aurantiaca TaxID=41 RepID=A0A1H8BN61_STIAU|nr:DNA methyltransferase [Stigmatella aurantiaca]SEM84202.1 hypothetical protein SAMN05444354_12438 [Stigmatella aurantiaca]
MALHPKARKILTKAVNACRDALERDTRDQLERVFGFQRSGVPRPVTSLELDPSELAISEALREWHRHLTGLFRGTQEERQNQALNRMLTETAFTVLHRLVALCMMEERGVLPVAVLRAGEQSEGFRLYANSAQGGLGDTTATYRAFLERVFDEVTGDLGVIFDRREPASLVFPSETCLRAVVGKLTDSELAEVWGDDETIGWVYQDFHSEKERKQMRGGKNVPADGYALAVCNQLFTPRWVVELLTDNTLGRIWIEMNGGESPMMEELPSLHRGEAHHAIPRKDPRDLRVLDPACGSGHFLLYAYDVLERIYEEAWQRHYSAPGRKGLREDYPDHAVFRRVLPTLILRHNLFGVDIDRRPLQVAALALWLRAQRSWREEEVRYSDRPPITRTNLVCAEPMPGDAKLLSEFTADLKPPVLGELVQQVWHAMRQVGETGLLLRIDQEIRSAVKRAREAWTGSSPSPDDGELFPNWDGRRHQIRELAPDPGFWDEAEGRVLQAIESYAARAAEGERILKRLFAEDAERGFAFIDLSRLRFDVVLMNPPFGHPAAGTKEELDAAYPACGHEIYAMFFQRTLELTTPYGRVGAITERDWLSQKTLRRLREQVFGEKAAVVLGVDICFGALEAKVETAAVVVDRRADLDTEALWVRLATTERKEQALQSALRGDTPGLVHTTTARRFRMLPLGAYAYWMSKRLADRVAKDSAVIQKGVTIKQGTATAEDFRFVRAHWEVEPGVIGLNRKWPRFAKGGEYRHFWDDVHLLLKWDGNGEELKAFSRSVVRNENWIGMPGIFWPLRTNLPLNPRVLPAGCAFGHKAPTAFADRDMRPSVLAVLSARPTYLLLLPWLNTNDWSSRSISKSYEVGVVNSMPWPGELKLGHKVEEIVLSAIGHARAGQLVEDETAETCAAFVLPTGLCKNAGTLASLGEARARSREEAFVALATASARIDEAVASAYDFDYRDHEVLSQEMEPGVETLSSGEIPDAVAFQSAYTSKSALDPTTIAPNAANSVHVVAERRREKLHSGLRSEEDLCRLFSLTPERVVQMRRSLGLLRTEDVERAASDIVSWAVGAAFGRWDVRLLDHTGWTPGWLDPWGPLPVCPLGQLVDGSGLPASAERIASSEWWLSRREATIPPRVVEHNGCRWLVDESGNRVAEAEVAAAEYPLTVAWDGILRDDALEDGSPTRHPMDLSRRVQQVFELVWATEHAAREAELADALGVASLRDWFRRTDSFFSDHLKRYSKSGRKAPIYWPLSTDDGLLTLWIYYPRLNASMLAGLVNHLDQHLAYLRREVDALELRRKQLRVSDADQARADTLAGAIESRTRMLNTLRGLVDRAWSPHLDDGVVVTAGPLRDLFRHRDWRKLVNEVWAEMMDGEHDWSHVAMWARPDEVLRRCRTEKDLAIAHNRLDLYIEPAPTNRRGRKKVTQLELDAAADEEMGDD